MKSLRLIPLVSLLCVINAAAQNVEKKLPPIAATVGNITDKRTTDSFPECTVELKFLGDAAVDAQRVSSLRLTKAEDDLGRDLRRKDDESDSSGSRSHNEVLKAELKLRNPSRNAPAIKVLEGEVDLFFPTESNGGIHIIKNLLGKPGEPRSDDVLRRHQVEVMYLTKESYEAKKKELQAAKAQGEQLGEKFGEAFGDLFKGMFAGWISESKNAVNIYIADPQKRVVEIELQDGNGKPLKKQSSTSSSSFRQINLVAPAPADTQVKVFLASPEAIKTFKFKVENVPLP